MNLVLAARREDRLRKLADTLAANHGVQADVVAVDLAESGAAAPLWEVASQGRAIHLLVNNAGFGLRGRFEEIPLTRQVEMVQLNCTAVMELAHLALPGMRGRGEGGIINVSSIVAFQAIPLMAVYAASKAFVLSFSEALREENRRHGVRVVALCPGPVATGFQEVAGTTVTDKTLGIVPAEQVARAALDALESRAGVVVPGFANRAGAAAAKLLPRQLVTRLARQILEKTR